MLTSKAITRIDLPHEPGEWIAVKLPSLAVLEAAGAGNTEMAQSRIMLEHCITAWSYDADVTPQNIGDLDFKTVQFLAEHISGTSEPVAKNA